MCRVIPGHRKMAQGMPDDFRATKKRLTGVGPAYLAWEASVLPMYYSRIINIFYAGHKNFSITIFSSNMPSIIFCVTVQPENSTPSMFHHPASTVSGSRYFRSFYLLPFLFFAFAGFFRTE